MDNLFVMVLISIIGPLLGSAIGVIHKPSPKFIMSMMAFAAGVMISISFINLIPESIKISSILICCIGVIAGCIVMLIVDKVIPHIHRRHVSFGNSAKMRKAATLLFIGIFMHNFPEGMAMAIGAVSGLKIGLAVVIAIAIQNIPEGICTSAPYYYFSKNRMKSFLVSSTIAIPIITGFIFSYFIYSLLPFNLIGFIMAATAGMMIYISADELIPLSCSSDTNHHAIISFIAGVVMVIILGII